MKLLKIKQVMKIALVVGLGVMMLKTLEPSFLSKAIESFRSPCFTFSQRNSSLEEAKSAGTKSHTWTRGYVLEMEALDALGRARQSHIILQAKHMLKQAREPRLTYNPVGWHNYKFDGKWLMNRGHLVGYQFSGLDDEARNLVPETAYMNAGALSGMDKTNTASMLFYENRLAGWLRMNPDKWLDYTVTPIYKDKELLPRKVQLNYVGFDKKGNLIPLCIGGHETQAENNTTQVTLDNISPNAVINYVTGTAQQKK